MPNVPSRGWMSSREWAMDKRFRAWMAVQEGGGDELDLEEAVVKFVWEGLQGQEPCPDEIYCATHDARILAEGLQHRQAVRQLWVQRAGGRRGRGIE